MPVVDPIIDIFFEAKQNSMLYQGCKACEMRGRVATLAPSLEDVSTEKVSCATKMHKDCMCQSFVALSSSLYGGEQCILWLARFYEAKYVCST